MAATNAARTAAGTSAARVHGSPAPRPRSCSGDGTRCHDAHSTMPTAAPQASRPLTQTTRIAGATRIICNQRRGRLLLPIALDANETAALSISRSVRRRLEFKKGGSRCGSAVWWARNRLATTLETPRCARSAPPCSRHSSGRWCRRDARTLGRTAGADTAALRTGGNTPPTPVRRPAVVGGPEASGERTPRHQQSKQRRP